MILRGLLNLCIISKKNVISNKNIAREQELPAFIPAGLDPLTVILDPEISIQEPIKYWF